MRGCRKEQNRNKRDSYQNIMHFRLLVKDRKFLASSCPIAKGFRARGLIMRQKEKRVASYCHKESLWNFIRKKGEEEQRPLSGRYELSRTSEKPINV